jgi:hypothetical protein
MIEREIQRETISMHEALEKAVMPNKMKLILKARTQMVESMYKYFDLDLSESHRVIYMQGAYKKRPES